jgi:hypothetical protein
VSENKSPDLGARAGEVQSCRASRNVLTLMAPNRHRQPAKYEQAEVRHGSAHRKATVRCGWLGAGMESCDGGPESGEIEIPQNLLLHLPTRARQSDESKTHTI